MSDVHRDQANVMADVKCCRAFRNLNAAIDTSTSLPGNPFGGTWVDFHFFDPDWMFEGAFVGKVLEMLNIEGAGCACIVNLSRERGHPSSGFVVNRSVRDIDYQQRLAGSGVADGWVYEMEPFGCTSDLGTWCIYCERASELAVIGFNVKASQDWEKFLVESLRASRVGSRGASEAPQFELPRHSISLEWQQEIIRNFHR